MSELLNITETSQKLRLKIPTLYKMICQRRIPFIKLGSRVLFSEEKLDNWVEENSTDPIKS